MENFELQVNEFKGPLEKLLELIEARKMDITTVSLAAVTGDFLAYVEKLEEVQSRMLANFIVIAAKLILIKSHALLPTVTLTKEEEEEIGDLELRLKIYQKCKQAERHIEELWNKRPTTSRAFLATIPEDFYCTQAITPQNLFESLQALISILNRIMEKQESGQIAVMSLEEQMTQLMSRMDRLLKTNFNDLSSGREKRDVVILFLAILHLCKDNLISLRQDESLGEIHIEKRI
jgi:segregation and condensation protein A